MKKYRLCLVPFVLCLALVACSGGSDNNTPGATTDASNNCVRNPDGTVVGNPAACGAGPSSINRPGTPRVGVGVGVGMGGARGMHGGMGMGVRR